jgi:amino acid permease
MAAEKYDTQEDVLGSKEPAPYAEHAPEDVETGGPQPLKRALESRHMQMIAIVSLSLCLSRRMTYCITEEVI